MSAIILHDLFADCDSRGFENSFECCYQEIGVLKYFPLRILNKIEYIYLKRLAYTHQQAINFQLSSKVELSNTYAL